MKKLGEGWQYSAYDLGCGKVYKKFHSKPRIYWNIAKTIFPFKKNPFWRIPSYAHSSYVQAIESLDFLEKSNIDNSLFANFKRKNLLDYEQDKVVIIKDYLESISIQEGKEIIKKFIDLNKYFIANGFIEKSFNIGKNFGIDTYGKVVLIDVGELWSDSRKIKKQLLSRAWTKHYIINNIPKDLRDYFIKEMDKNFHPF